MRSRFPISREARKFDWNADMNPRTPRERTIRAIITSMRSQPSWRFSNPFTMALLLLARASGLRRAGAVGPFARRAPHLLLPPHLHQVRLPCFGLRAQLQPGEVLEGDHHPEPHALVRLGAEALDEGLQGALVAPLADGLDRHLPVVELRLGAEIAHQLLERIRAELLERHHGREPYGGLVIPQPAGHRLQVLLRISPLAEELDEAHAHLGA